ncbi:sortase family protein [Isoptericola jiangsuensis]|uniref:Sortase family protein n=1 Tax=Isoptericola jiangsuensis TaxID=548579 RepID=A0A2A9EWS8_9MICO|nr:class F sortase [Isoptericola jiangsuensis]PFG43328.1 sortase family protein [Isoptericola jiangsuensis]
MSTQRTAVADRARRLVRRGGPRRWAVVVGTGVLAAVVAVVGLLGGRGVGTEVPRATAPEVRTAVVAGAPAATGEPRPPGGRGTDPRPAAGSATGTVPDVPVRSADLAPADPVARPVRVVVDSTLDVPVRAVGVDPDGSMELPGSGDVAGWYRYGAAPGQDEGNVVIASHVDTSDGVGAFAALATARPGQRVTVVDADGTRYRYRVTDVRRYDKSTVPLDALFERGGDPRLVLITCGGRWDAAAGSYEDNLVVTAVPGAPGRSDR